MQKLVHGYVDGELDLPRSLEIDQHLEECAGCAQVYSGLQAARTALKDRAPYFQAPSSLQKRIRLSIRKASKTEGLTPILSWRVLALAASVGFILVTGWALLSMLPPRSEPVLAQVLLDRHVGSQMLPGRLVDVKSSDRHTVKPWLSGKVDFSPAVPDLSDHEFSLVGGRLDYLDNRQIAALVYQRREHVINLFIWPAGQGAEAPQRAETRRGFHLLHWTQSGMTYWAVSDLNEAELHEFARLLQEKAR